MASSGLGSIRWFSPFLFFSLLFPSSTFAQTLAKDRADSIFVAADTALGSAEGKALWALLRADSESDPDLKQAFVLEEKLQGNERELSRLQAEQDSLRARASGRAPSPTLDDLNRKIDRMNEGIARIRGENNRLKRQKQALFEAKIIGAGFAAFSMFLQIQGIRDAIQRVKIKETDLARRRATLVDPKTGGPGPDMLKLQILEERMVQTRSTVANLQKSAVSSKTLLRAQQEAVNAATELEQWKNVLTNTRQKIAEAALTNQIDARSILRQKISVGLTAIGTLVIGLFGDRILLKLQEWLESDDPEEQEERTLSYLRSWNAPRVMLASMLPMLESGDLEPWDKALLFFAESSELQLHPGVLERALLRYRTENPSSYAALRRTAEWHLVANLREEFLAFQRRVRIEIEVREELAHPSLYWSRHPNFNPRDATYVAPKIIPPPGLRNAAPGSR